MKNNILRNTFPPQKNESVEKLNKILNDKKKECEEFRKQYLELTNK